MAGEYILSASQVFLLLFIMLGPMSLPMTFAAATVGVGNERLKIISFKTIMIAAILVFAGGYLGSLLLQKWQISKEVMLLTGGLIFFVIGLRIMLQSYYTQPVKELHVESSAENHGEERSGEVLIAEPAPMALAFPMVVTPYGMASVIVLLAASHDAARVWTVFKVLLALLVLNWLAMAFARSILKYVGKVPFRMLGAALGVLQLALAVQIILVSLRALGLITILGLNP